MVKLDLIKWWLLELKLQCLKYRPQDLFGGFGLVIAKRVWFNGIYLEKEWWETLDELKTRKIEKIFSCPTFYDFKLKLFMHSMIGWEFFIVPVWNWFWKVVWFRFLDPRTMVKFYSQESWEITRYEQRVNGKEPVKFTTDELSYYQIESNPNNEFEWLSFLEWVVYDALTDKEAMERNYLFFENGQMPDWIIILDSNLPASELEVAKEKLEGQLKWTENSHKMMITNSVKDFKNLSLSSKDIDFINQRKLTVEKVCSIFGVPRSVLWYVEDVNRSNGDNNYKQYILGTIRPYEEWLNFIMNELYLKFVWDDLSSRSIEIECDWENVEDREAIEESQRKDIELWLKTIDQIRNERWDELFNIKGVTDVPLMKTTIQILGATKPETTPVK